MERIVRRYRIKAVRRGFYPVSQLNCHAPSRLFRRIYMMDRKTQEGVAGLYVYPAMTDCSLLLRAVEVILGEKESTKRVLEDPFNFASIRPYTIYDPMKTINWKASARTGELMVNTYASPAAIRVRIFLDVSADPNIPFSDSFRELAIAMAASLIRILMKRQQDASLMINCHSTSGQDQTDLARSTHPRSGAKKTDFPWVSFPTCMGPEKLTAIEQFLTGDFNQTSTASFTDLIRDCTKRPDLSGESDEVFIFLTSADNRKLRDAIHTLLGARNSGLLAVMSRTADHRREEQERNLHILPVYNVDKTIS